MEVALAGQAVLFIAVGLWVTFLVSSNLTRPLQQIIQVLRMVREGWFDEKVRVTSNDEIGYIGINPPYKPFQRGLFRLCCSKV